MLNVLHNAKPLCTGLLSGCMHAVIGLLALLISLSPMQMRVCVSASCGIMAEQPDIHASTDEECGDCCCCCEEASTGGGIPATDFASLSIPDCCLDLHFDILCATAPQTEQAILTPAPQLARIPDYVLPPALTTASSFRSTAVSPGANVLNGCTIEVLRI